MPLVVIYLQKASLKAVGLISRNKAVVVAGKDHLGCKKNGKHKRQRDSKQERVERHRKNRTEIRNAKIANTVQAPVHKEVNSCCG